MFFEKKEDNRKLPDLPAPRYPARSQGFGVREEEDNILPAFPDSPSGNKFSEAAIKDAVGSEESKIGLPPSQDGEEGSSLVEMEEWEPSHLKSDNSNFPIEAEHNESYHEKARIEPPPVSRHAVRERENKVPVPSDVFVKIDKFHSARRALGEIKGKLSDIDELIKKIRETKIREEQELANWEKDVMHIKSRVENVNENIFEKVD